MNEIFHLDERAAADDYDGLGSFAERYPVEDDHSAMLAIDAALYPPDGQDPVIVAAAGWSAAVDLLADGDGRVDGWRLLVRPPGWDYDLAGCTGNVPNPYQPDGSIEYPDTAGILRDAVAEASALAAFALQHPAGSHDRPEDHWRSAREPASPPPRQDSEYTWTDASALWQAEHGQPGARTDSAVTWLAGELRRRLDADQPGTSNHEQETRP